MAAFCFFLLFSLLSFTSSANLRRRYLSDDAVLSPPAFFPLYSAASPPPPPPPPPAPSLPPPATTVATFPANISALVLPRSPKPHRTSNKLLVPVISAVLAVAIAIGIALFLYGRYRSQIPNLKDESKSLATDITQSESGNITNNSLSVAATTSEILYHSNVVTTTTTSSSVDERRVAPRSSFVKPESPEIRPLPPLPACSFIHYYEAEGEEENDDFYSPLASLAGTENTIRPGLANPYSTCSCSSSSSHSPVMSQTVTNSPPMSSTAPNWSGKQNPKLQQVERRVRSNKRNGSLPLRMFSLWNQNVGFPRISSASTSPEGGMPDAYARSSMYSSVSTSPDRFFLKASESSPPKWTDLRRNVKSLLLSSTSISPNRDYCINIGESSSRYLKSSWENPQFVTSEHCESAVHPPPQRPPPPPLVAQKPPPLVPPSQPFVGKKLSFSELPQNCWEAIERPKPKLKPLPWDKVRPSSYRKTSWDRLRSNSFKLNEGIMETPSSSNTISKQRRSLSCDLPMINQDIRVSDPRKGQDITILLTTLKLTTNDVCQALLDGHYEALGVELLQRLSVMAPSEEEEDILKIYTDDSAIKLTPSDRFLKELLNVPSAFERVDALLSVANFDSKLQHLKNSFSVIQAACEELRNSKMLLRLLEAILETSHDSKLDTLLELLDMQGLEGRANLIHSVVQNIIESEGTEVSDSTCRRKLGLQVITKLTSSLVDVKKSADIDYDVLRTDVSKLYERVNEITEILQLSEESGVNKEQWWKFRESITRFLETAAEEIKELEKEEVSVLSAVKQITEYFHGDPPKEEGQVLRIFVIVRDFLSILDEVCKEMEAGD